MAPSGSGGRGANVGWRRRLAPATVNRVLAAVSSFYEYAILAGVWDRANPIEKRPDPALAAVAERHRPFMGRASRQRPVRRAMRVKTPQRVPRPLTDGQVHALLGALRGVRDRAIVLLMLQGGLRPGSAVVPNTGSTESTNHGWEVLGLQLEDIAYGRRRVVVRHREDHPKGVRQKSRQERVVDLHEPEALAAVSEYVMNVRPPTSTARWCSWSAVVGLGVWSRSAMTGWCGCSRGLASAPGFASRG